jgi:predicted SnoaL-like aldol condensation-catalyzing enzyme
LNVASRFGRRVLIRCGKRATAQTANLRNECRRQNAQWPLAESRKAVADEFGEVCQGVPGESWTLVRVLNEGDLTVENFLQQFAQDPPASAASVPPR